MQLSNILYLNILVSLCFHTCHGADACSNVAIISSQIEIEWTSDGNNIDFRVIADLVGRWVSFGISDGMLDTKSDIVIGFFDEDDEESVEDYDFVGYVIPPLRGNSGIYSRSLERTNGQTVLEFSRRLNSSSNNKELEIGDAFDIVWAYGSDEELGYHLGNRGTAVLRLTCGNCETGEWECATTGECISERRECNGITDCGDGSDEDRHCGGVSCEDDESWESGWGPCNSYAQGEINSMFCGADFGRSGIIAAEACRLACNTCEDYCNIEVIGREESRLYLNGFYYYGGMFNDKPFYYDNEDFLYLFYTGNAWVLASPLGDSFYYALARDADAESPDKINVSWEVSGIIDEEMSSHCGTTPGIYRDGLFFEPAFQQCEGDAWQSGHGTGCFVEEDMKFSGRDIDCIDRVAGNSECCSLCENDRNCHSWTFQKRGSNHERCCLKSIWREAAVLNNKFDSGYPRRTDNELCTSRRTGQCEMFGTECIQDGIYGTCDTDCECGAFYDCEPMITPTKFVGETPNYCQCYAGAFECPYRSLCVSEVGFSVSPFCVRTFPKVVMTPGNWVPAIGPGNEYCYAVNRFIGPNNDQQFQTNRGCDGLCSAVKHGQACTLDNLGDIQESIRLWLEAFTSPAVNGGGYVDYALAQLARAQTEEQSCSDFLGWIVMAVVELCRGEEFVDHSLTHQVKREGHIQESHGVSNTTDPCIIESGIICTEALLEGIALGRGSADSLPETDQITEILETILSVCPDELPFAATGIEGDALPGVATRIKEAVTMLTPERDCEPCSDPDQIRVCHFNRNGEIVSQCQTDGEWLETTSKKDFLPFDFYEGNIYDCECNPRP